VDKRYEGIDGVQYERYETSPGVFETFARRPGVEGILPELQRKLGEARKATKRLMAKEKNPFKHSLLDAKQLAEKLTMNSIYGFTGATTSPLPLVAIAAAITCTGRDIINRTKAYLEENMEANVIYGVSGWYLILVSSPVYMYILDGRVTGRIIQDVCLSMERWYDGIRVNRPGRRILVRPAT
jgi:DNA polymerase delta subunit 1